MGVEKTLIQTLACQLSSTFMQLLFSFDQDMRVEKTLIQTLACQLSSTLMQLLFSFDQGMRVEKTLIQTLVCQLLFSFDKDFTNRHMQTLLVLAGNDIANLSTVSVVELSSVSTCDTVVISSSLVRSGDAFLKTFRK